MKKTKIGKTQQTATLEWIGPAVAAKYMEKNKNPRSVRQSHVDKYVRIIQAGEFRTAQSIGFDLDGYLRDGQHRLLAIIATGTPVQMWVIRNMSEDEVLAIDQGEKRNNSVILSVDTRAGAVITLASTIMAGSSRAPLTSELMCVRDAILDSCMDLLHGCTAAPKHIASRFVRLAAVLNMVKSPKHYAYVKTQYPALVRSDFDVQSKPIQYLYKRLTMSVRSITKSFQFMTAYLAFDPAKAEHKTIVIKDPTKLSADIQTELLDIATRA